MAGSGALRIWIADGSPAPFPDIVRLDVTHPTITGAPAAYKGWMDDAVLLGEGVVAADRADDVFFPEAEWCVLLPEASRACLAEPDRLQPDTPVVLQGLIEGKWLNRFIGEFAWRAPSMGNNLLAEGPGIPTTFAAIEAGAVGGAAQVVLRYPWRHGGREGTQEQRSRLADLRGHNLLEMVRAVLRRCRDRGEGLDGVDCAAIGPDAAQVNEPRWLQAAFASAGLKPADLTSPEAWHRVLAAMARGIIEEGRGALPGSGVEIAVTDAEGRAVGRGSLTWQRGGPAGLA
jgi:hypothetical protein